MQAKIHVGTSGYIYKHWGAGIFYPKGLPQNKWLEYYCQHMDSVELNVSFYRLPSLSAFRGWHKRTPNRFMFAVKGSRYITHIKRLKDPKPSLKLFFSRTKPLKKKLSVVLWQLAPQFKLNKERLEEFVETLVKVRPCRQVFEFRHPSWFCEEVYKILNKANIAICLADWPECSKETPDTADFVYIRRHGASGQLYSGCYSEEQLQQDAYLIRQKKKTSYIYFNNDAHGWAIKNAIRLKKIIEN